jgi:hypothetical protein
MALKDLLYNDPSFNYYYGGQGNFIQKNMPWDNTPSPYIKWPINGERISPSGDELLDTIILNRSSKDYPIRGASSGNVSPYGTNVPQAAYIDSIRIRRYLSSPQGKLFIDKQVGLQISNPLIEVGSQINLNNVFDRNSNVFQNIGSTRFLGETEATRIFNRGRNLISQVSVGGSGIHMDRHGVVPFNAPGSKYEEIVRLKPTEENRLNLLYISKLVRDDIGRTNITRLSRVGISSDRGILFDYLGGPKSFFGIGSTLIKRYVNTTQENPAEGPNLGEVTTHNLNALNKVYTFTQIAQSSSSRNNPQEIPSDFRTNLSNVGYGEYNSFNLEVRRGMGRPGFAKNTYDNYSKKFPESIDKLNELRSFYGNLTGDKWTDPDYFGADSIKFGFETINNDDPDLGFIIMFRAFLDSFNDNHNAEYQSFKYVGRGDNFHTYQGWSRDITIGFKIAAQTRWEMNPLYQKLNTLVSQIYPDYSMAGFMRAPMVKLTVGDYIYRQPGFIKSMGITIEKDFPWEIRMDYFEKDKYMRQLPQILSININFTPVHDFLSRNINSDESGHYPYIGEKFSDNIYKPEDLMARDIANQDKLENQKQSIQQQIEELSSKATKVDPTWWIKPIVPRFEETVNPFDVDSNKF